MHFLVTVAVLVTAPPSGGAGARLGEARAALVAAERARGADVVDDAMELWKAGWVSEASLAFFGEGARLVEEGKRALARVELERAAATFAEAERVYEPHCGQTGAKVEAAEAAKWHGVALFELKQRAEANEAWSRATLLDPTTELTEAMVRPEVARAFALAPTWHKNTPIRCHVMPQPKADASATEISAMQSALGVDEVIVAAIAMDAGVLTYAAARRGRDCGTAISTSTRADELVRQLEDAPCRAGAEARVAEAPAIVHPRPAPSLTKAVTSERRPSVWRRPWLWVGVVGALGVGVVLAASLWPRDASYSAVADFHSFALGAR